MNFGDLILRNDEKAIFTLRELYRSYGYSQFKMRKFEEYDLYVKNKDFLISDSVITFTDTNGKLMAMKPDVTLSIIKNTKDNTGVQKLFYNENVYRVSSGSHAFEELMQVGLECIGSLDFDCICEVLMLAAESLRSISADAVLDISHMGIFGVIFDSIDASFDLRKDILHLMGERNVHELTAVCEKGSVPAEITEVLKTMVLCSGKASEMLPRITAALSKCGADEALSELGSLVSALEKSGYGEMINIDFSVVSDVNYYNGIVFKGFINDVPSSVLSGGQYDSLMRRMGRSDSAIGFAVYLNMLERMDEQSSSDADAEMLNIALPKGRLGEKVYDMFERAGFECPSIKDPGRKLIFENPACGVRYFWVKPSDVAIYVERGAADIGVAGKDILLEYTPDIYELLDLDIGKCRMAVAAPKGFKDDKEKTLRVATKFRNIAENYYSSLGREIDIIHLNGSIEIAPILGLSDVIVDIVETGSTLRENNLEVVETVVPISARLIANKSSSKFKSAIIEKIVSCMAAETEARK